MGQQTSRPNQNLSRNGSLRGSIRSKVNRQLRKKNLSAVFNVQETDISWELLNINTATEEELMTLPGINRTVAHSIVEYRQAIGGFKKVEDLALVTGVGATKLELFRGEITINYKKRVPHNNSFLNGGTSRCSSRNQSLESLPTSETGSVFTTGRHSFRPSSAKMVNVNNANVFQLMTIRGVDQELAANIVDFRDRKGPFTNTNDILKVKGMSPAKLSAIRTNLIVEKPPPNQVTNLKEDNNGNKIGLSSHASFCYGSLKQTPSSHRRTRSVPPGSSSPKGAESLLKEVYGILLRQSVRPIVEDVFNNARNGKAAIRAATWNIGDFSVDKSKNPGVQEVICRTILENGISLLVLHELRSEEALNTIVSELNEPTLPKTISWEGERGKWKASIPATSNINNNIDTEKSSKVFSGFLFESSHGLKLTDSSILILPPPASQNDPPMSKILLGWFKMGSSDFMVVSCLLSDVSQSQPEALAKLIKEKFPMESNILMIEALSQSSYLKTEGFKSSSCPGFREFVPSNTSTVLNGKAQCTRIWISDSLDKLLTGFWGVVKDGLHHLAIPNGWTWGGPVSKSCPIWLEMFVECKSTPVPIPNGLRLTNNANGIPPQNPSSNNL